MATAYVAAVSGGRGTAQSIHAIRDLFDEESGFDRDWTCNGVRNGWDACATRMSNRPGNTPVGAEPVSPRASGPPT